MMLITLQQVLVSEDFPVGDRNSFSYGYAYSESKNNRNLNDTTADETNAIGHNVSLDMILH